MMTKSHEIQAVIYGSFILYLIHGLLDKSQHSKATTIRLKQLLIGKTSRKEYNEYVVLSNEAWQMVIKKYEDVNYRIAIFDVVELLAFDAEEIMTEFYGNNFIAYASAFALKQTQDGVEADILKESREISKSLIKATQKVVFDYKDKL